MQSATFVKSAVLALSTALAATAAGADTGTAYVTGVTPVFEVVSNGQSYTQAKTLGNVGISGKLKFDTGVAGRVKSWEAWPVMENGYGIAALVPGLGFYKQQQSYGIGNRPKTLNKTLSFGIPAGMIANNAVGMCNWKANALRNEGKSNKQIFSENHDLTFKVSLSAKVDSTGAGSNNQIWEYSAPKTYKLRCLKWRGAAIDTVGGIQAKPDATHGKAKAGAVLKSRTKAMPRAMRAAN